MDFRCARFFDAAVVGIAAGPGRISRGSRLIPWPERSRCSVGASRSSNRQWGSVLAAAAEVITSGAVAAVVGVRGSLAVVFWLWLMLGLKRDGVVALVRVIVWP